MHRRDLRARSVFGVASRVLLAAATAGFVAVLVGEDASGGEIVSSTEVSQQVRAEARQEGDVIRVDVTNVGSDPVSDVRVVVSASFRWSHETSPGPQSPSQAMARTLPDRILPGETASFEWQAALPERPDGEFVTRVEVIGFRVHPAGAAASARAQEPGLPGD